MPLRDFHETFPAVCERLLQARRQGRSGHAYLLAGDDVTFLQAFARAWVQVCACMTPRPDGDACGQCPTCTALAGANYPELFELRPQSKARFIIVDDIRALEHRLGLTAEAGRLKVGLIVEADRMVEQAQNAFLKTLEEPTPNTLLVLLSAQPRNLLPTIRSRCQTVSLLRNRPGYEFALGCGVIQAVAPLRRQAGAAVALAAARALLAILGRLHEQAEAAVGDRHDERWDVVTQHDKALKKRLEEEHQVLIEAEYIRLRQQVADAVYSWFMQRYLLACGVPAENLPHPEFQEAAGAAAGPAPAPADAERDVVLAADLLRYLAGNVQEQLAVDAFCLSVCERTS